LNIHKLPGALVSTQSTSHKNNLMRAARWRMAAEIFAGMEFKL
jgi:hypothetical protein